jgi:Zn-dependent peptidase ImmA (M78 family)
LEGQLTPTQAERFAQLVNVPFGFLFLKAPPDQRAAPLPDFRSVQDREPLGQEFFDVYDDVIYKQTWYSDYLQSIDADPIPFIGKYIADKVSAIELAKDIRNTIGLTPQLMDSISASDDLYSVIVGLAEKVGVLVFKNGVVGNNTRRPIEVAQFRGFAIADQHAPAIFINGRDAKAAWLFTLVHELAHLWLGASGVSDAAPKSNDPVEVLCNATAAEVLVPADQFLTAWMQLDGNQADARIAILRRRFKVSRLVIARRALDHSLIGQQAYQLEYEAAKRTGDTSGGNFYSTLSTRNGKRFSDTVATLAYAGELGLRHAGRLLNTTPSNVLNYYERRHAVPS